MKEVKLLSKEYIEGPEAAKRFEKAIRHVLSVSSDELRRREKQWKKERKAQHGKSRSS